jgi:hypothetical protein
VNVLPMSPYTCYLCLQSIQVPQRGTAGVKVHPHTPCNFLEFDHAFAACSVPERLCKQGSSCTGWVNGDIGGERLSKNAIEEKSLPLPGMVERIRGEGLIGMEVGSICCYHRQREDGSDMNLCQPML